MRALRSAGHEVLAVAEISPRIGDEEVLKLARDDARVLLTEDTDFGELVYAEGLPNYGEILFRFPARARSEAAAAVGAVNQVGDEHSSRFTVIQPGRVRSGSGRP